ncbi:MAG: universal stress protein UspA [Nitrobacter vulgaris]|nr:universal stress protein UspA [Nitrobacter vulgaris]
MRSILVTVDDTPSAIAARGLAVALARQCGAMIRGVTAIEVSDLDRVEPIPIGGVQYAYDRLQHREKMAMERRARIADLPALFRRALADEGMEASCATMEADVRGGLLRMIETCDLVVTGRDAEFHLDPLEGVTPLVEHIIGKGCRPVVVSGPKQLGSGPVLVAYDGSAPAAKALQMAVLLGIFRPSGAHILSISRDRAAAMAIAERAREFLELHRVTADLEAVESFDHPADVVLKRAPEIGARLLVMGAFGHRGFRDILFGSSTRRLFDQVPLPLFIYH